MTSSALVQRYETLLNERLRTDLKCGAPAHGLSPHPSLRGCLGHRHFAL